MAAQARVEPPIRAYSVAICAWIMSPLLRNGLYSSPNVYTSGFGSLAVHITPRHQCASWEGLWTLTEAILADRFDFLARKNI